MSLTGTDQTLVVNKAAPGSRSDERSAATKEVDGLAGDREPPWRPSLLSGDAFSVRLSREAVDS
jgi:hypothetical protein